VPLPRGEMVVHRHGYEGGMVAILRDLATEHTISKRAVGSTARFTFERLGGKGSRRSWASTPRCRSSTS